MHLREIILKYLSYTLYASSNKINVRGSVALTVKLVGFCIIIADSVTKHLHRLKAYL